jgi:hypothetical protein
MKLLIATLALSLSACVSVPVEHKFPKAPEELMVSCPDLQLVPNGTTQLSTVLETITTNYGQYQLCQSKTDTWIQWYNDQKKIFDSVK